MSAFMQNCQLQLSIYHIVQAQCLATLLSYGLDLDIGDYAGDTAQRVAEIYGQTECLKAIEDHLKKKAEKLSREARGSIKSDSSSPRERIKSIGGAAIRFQDSPSSSRRNQVFSNPDIEAVKKE